MKCSLAGCPGHYEERQIVHTVQFRGETVVIDHVPAEVCSLCGDVLLREETIRDIESLLASGSKPTRVAPVYEYVVHGGSSPLHS